MRRKLRKSDIFDELKEKKQSPIIPIIIFLSIVTILFLLVFFVFSFISNKTNIELPWTEEKKEEAQKKHSSSRDEMEMLVPTLPIERNTYEISEAILKFTKIKADKNGYLITASLTAYEEPITIEVNEMVIDGFYISTVFSISDKIDYNDYHSPLREQQATTVDFRIKQTELDELGMFGFNTIKMFYSYETSSIEEKNKSLYLIARNDISIVNERKGLIQIDNKDDMLISYYKKVDAEEATYLYFDFKNSSGHIDYTINVKQLEINGIIYDMESFEEKVYRDSRRALYLKIPKKDFSYISMFNISFYILDKDNKGNIEYIYITNEYTKTY